MNYLVFDFGGTFAKYSVMDEDLNVYERDEKPAPVHEKQAFFDFVKGLYDQYAEQYDLKGIAISLPGVINEEEGILIGSGAYFPLYGCNVRQTLQEMVPVPVALENDGKCGVLGEVWKGALADCDDGVVIVLGTGVAGGVVINRRILKGKTFMAGEFSAYQVGPEKDMACSAQFRCATSTLLAKAMLKKGIDLGKGDSGALMKVFFGDQQKELSPLNDDPRFANGIDGKLFFKMLEEGDEDIKELYEEFVDSVAHMMINVALTTDPQKILIGGGISRQDRLIEDIRAAYIKRRDIFGKYLSPGAVVERCHFLAEANQYGALYHLLVQTGQIK